MSTYRVLGSNDEQTVCDHCGRTNLKLTVVLEDTDNGDIVRFGSSCAIRAQAVPGAHTKAQLDRKVIEANNKLDRSRYIVEHWSQFLSDEGVDLFIQRNPHTYTGSKSWGDVRNEIHTTVAQHRAILAAVAA